MTISKSGYQTFTQQVSASAGATTALGTLAMETASSRSDYTLPIAIAIVGVFALLAMALVLWRKKKKDE
jgi:LPXTG-motif cell wall-anchored protein